jgi:hypothetical protein
MTRAPYLKAAIMSAVLLALYGGFTLATWKAVPRSKFPPPAPMAMGHVPRSFACQMKFPSKTAFAIACVPDCRYKPDAVPPDRSTFIGMITASQTAPAMWHRACDGKK